MNHYPTLLILSDDCVSPSHGTGAVLLRHLREFPPDRIYHAFLNLKGDPFLPNSFQVDIDEKRARPWHKRWIPHRPANLAPTVSARELVATLARGPHIEVIYSNVFGEKGLQLLAEILDAFDHPPPVVHHAQDFLFENQAHFESMVKSLSSRITEFWAIGPALAREIKRITGRQARLMTPFQTDIQPSYKTTHREFRPDFTAVMLGNSHMPWVLHHLRTVWETLGREMPGLKPIQWYAYPNSVTYVTRAGVVFEPEIEYYGFLNDRVLHEHLCAADLAIVPFNIQDQPEYHYAEFSIPSRITEFMNAGLPIFAAAGRYTDAHAFITGNEIGRCATLADEDTFRDQLLACARDIELRKALGARARTFAETHCDIRNYRVQILDLFTRISRGQPTNEISS